MIATTTAPKLDLFDTDDVSLPDFVAELPAGTLFTETDDLGRRHPMMKAFHGRVILGNGAQGRPFTYGDRHEDGYSVEVTHVQIPVPDDAALETVAKAILAVGRADTDEFTVGEQVQRLWWNTPTRERALDQARAAYTAILGSVDV